MALGGDLEGSEDVKLSLERIGRRRGCEAVDPSAVTGSLTSMQQGLFDQPAEVDFSKDPYAEKRESGRRLAQEFAIDDAKGFDLMLAYGSERAARKALIQRWYRDEVERRDDAA